MIDRPDGVWTTREGEEIPIKKLGDTHLINILRMLWRNRRRLAYAQTLEAFSFGPPQGEMAQMAYEDALEECFDSEADPDDFFYRTYATLVEEAEKRDLQWEPQPPQPERKELMAPPAGYNRH